MYDVIEKDNIKIERMIYEIRGVQVMLDSDIAKLYNVETKQLNRQVRRNIERFPNDFCFKLDSDEYKAILRCQNGTLELKQGKYSKYLPYVFTEHGITALAGILHSETAIKMNIKIIRTFALMRHLINQNRDIYGTLNNINSKLYFYDNKMIEYDEKFNYLFSQFDKKEQLFLKGQTFSAYSNILEILNSAKENIIVIDEYADISFLDLIRNIRCNVILITKDSNRLSNLEIEKYNKEFNNLKVYRNNFFHDRFIIIDNRDIYLSGTSINNAGDKTFMIIKLEKESVKKAVLNDINKIINK